MVNIMKVPEVDLRVRVIKELEGLGYELRDIIAYSEREEFHPPAPSLIERISYVPLDTSGAKKSGNIGNISYLIHVRTTSNKNGSEVISQSAEFPSGRTFVWNPRGRTISFYVPGNNFGYSVYNPYTDAELRQGVTKRWVDYGQVISLIGPTQEIRKLTDEGLDKEVQGMIGGASNKQLSNGELGKLLSKWVFNLIEVEREQMQVPPYNL